MYSYNGGTLPIVCVFGKLLAQCGKPSGNGLFDEVKNRGIIYIIRNFIKIYR